MSSPTNIKSAFPTVSKLHQGSHASKLRATFQAGFGPHQSSDELSPFKADQTALV